CKLSLFKPSITTFTRIGLEANRGKDTFLPVLLTIIVSISLLLLAIAFFPNESISAVFTSSPGSGSIGQMVSFILLTVCFLPLFVFTQLLGYYAFAGSNFLFAKMLGGTGGWKETLLTFSAIFIPFTFITCVFAAVPYGGYLDIPVSIYFCFLITLSIKAVHQINWFKSITAVIIIPLVILGGLAALFYFGLIKPYMPQVLEQLQQQYPGGFNV
ncbi:MAG TPA: YIP1 family protein, partial [Longilinea sp.]|nr:YIP1 family protein [Longilinea sp.]